MARTCSELAIRAVLRSAFYACRAAIGSGELSVLPAAADLSTARGQLGAGGDPESRPQDAMAAGSPSAPLLLVAAAAVLWGPGAAFPVELAANNRSLELGDCSWVAEGARGHLGTVVSRCSVPNARLSTHVTLTTTQVVYAGEAPACTISCVRALDQLAETPLLNVTLVGGGPGHTFVALEVRAPVGHGYFFTVDAFLNCTGGAQPALRQVYLPTGADVDAAGGEGASGPSCWPCAAGSWF